MHQKTVYRSWTLPSACGQSVMSTARLSGLRARSPRRAQRKKRPAQRLAPAAALYIKSSTKYHPASHGVLRTARDSSLLSCRTASAPTTLCRLLHPQAQLLHQLRNPLDLLQCGRNVPSVVHLLGLQKSGNLRTSVCLTGHCARLHDGCERTGGLAKARQNIPAAIAHKLKRRCNLQRRQRPRAVRSRLKRTRSRGGCTPTGTGSHSGPRRCAATRSRR